MKRIKMVTALCLVGVISLYAATAYGAGKKDPPLKNGMYRTEIFRPDGNAIVFNFQLKDSLGKKIIHIMNASERMVVDSVVKRGDSVFIELPFYDSRLWGKIQPTGNIEGQWIKRAGDKETRLPFRAKYNDRERFKVKAAPAYSVSGRWEVTFTGANGKSRPSVGEFLQQGHRLTGTFVNTTGDYRYLEGVVDGDSLKLSAFDGAFAFLFTARIENDSTISGGKYYSAATGTTSWTARKNESAVLHDEIEEYSGNDTRIKFDFETVAGKRIVHDDPLLKGKVYVIQVLGSWCPNCFDETKFLNNYYLKNRDRGFEVLGLAYERKAERESSVRSLIPLIKKYNVAYPIALSGVAVSDTLKESKTIPQLGKIQSYPTTVFVDKKGNIRKIHSGFSGPATGIHYERYIKEFEATIDELLAE